MKISLYERFVLSTMLVRENTQTNSKVDYLYSITKDADFLDVFADELRSLEKKGLIEYSNQDWHIAPSKLAMLKSWFMQIKRPSNYQTMDLLSMISMSLEEIMKRDGLDNPITQGVIHSTINNLKNKIV